MNEKRPSWAEVDYSEIEPKLLERELQEKVKNFKCESCNSNDWLLSQNSTDRFVPILPSINPATNLIERAPTLPLVTLICQVCGYTRLYSKTILRAAIKARHEHE